MSRRRVPVPWIVVGMLAAVWGLVVWLATAEDDGNTVFVPGFDVQLTDADRPATVVVEGSDWVLERPPGVPCVRLRIGERATECLSMQYRDHESATAVFEAPDGRVFIQVFGGPSLARLRVFTSAGDETLTPVVPEVPGAGAGAVAIAELAPGEEPYGVQAFGEDGTLLSIQSLVGALG